MGIKNVFKWRVTTNKYLYLVDEENQAPFILDKKTGDRIYPQPMSGSTVTGTTVVTGMSLDEGLISQSVSNIKSADVYSEKYDKMVKLTSFDSDASKLTFLEYDKYFNLGGDECVQEATTPKCEGYEPVFNVSAHTLQNSGETEVEYSFYAERNEADKTLRYNLDLGIPRGEKGEKGEDGIGCKGDKGDDGLDAIISNVDADITAIGPYEEPSVEVVSSKTGDNEYELNFNFRLPRGEQGEEGPVGDDGEPGWNAVVKNVTATAKELAPGSTPYAVIPSSSITVHDNTEDKVHETSFKIDFGLPTGLQGIQGNDGLNAEIRNVTARVIETLEPGYWDPDEYDENRRWVRNNAEAGVTVTPDGGGNVVDLDFWFKIPRGDKGDTGGTGSGGTGGGGWIYNFMDPQFTPTPGLQTPIGDWDLRYHPLLGEVDVYLQIYYPEDWGGGAECDDDCRKHRYDHYQNNSDSLSEGMLEVINGVLYPLATAQGIRSHAEGIGMELPPYSYVEVKVEGNDDDNNNITIPKNTIPVGVEFDDIVGLQLYLNNDDAVLNVTLNPSPGDKHNYPGIPSGVTEQEFCDTIKNSEMTIVAATLVNSEDDYFQYSNVIVQYTISGVTYESHLGYLVSNEYLYDNKLKLNFIVNPSDAIGVATHTEGRACQAVGDYSHAEGWDTLARGPHSHTEGLGTYTTNLSEHAEGQYNVSHSEDRTDFNNLNGCSTVSSIGIGEDDEDRKNAIEVMQNGDIYVYGVGNYDGTDVKCQNSEVETLQDVLNHLRSDVDKEKELRGQVIPVILPEYSGDEPPANPSIGEYWHNTGNNLLMIYGYSGNTLVWKTADISLKFIDKDRDSIYIYNSEVGYWNSEYGNVEYLYLSKNTNDLLMWDDSQGLFVTYNNGETTPSVYFIKVAEVYESMPESAPTSMLHEYVLISDGTDYVLYQGIYDENVPTHVIFEEVTDPIYTNAIYFDSNDYATLYFNSDSDFNENKFQTDSTGFLENVYYVNVINGDVYGLNDGVLVLLSVVPLPDTVTLNVNTEHGSKSYKSLTTAITDKLVNYNKPGVYTLNILNNESGLATVYTLEVTEKNGNHRVQHIYNNDVSYTREQFKNKRRGRVLTWGKWSTWNVFFYRDTVNFELRNISKDATTSDGYTYKDSNVAVRVMSQDMEFVRLNEEFITVRLYRKHNKNRINKFRLIHTPITTNDGVRYTPVSIVLSKCNRGKNSPIYTLPLTVKNCMDSLISVRGSVVDNGTTVNVTDLNQIMKYGCGNEYTSGVTIYRKGVDSSDGASFAAYGYAKGFKYDTEDGIAHPSISITLGINVVLGNGTGNTTHYNASPIEACRYRVSYDGGEIKYGMTQSFTKSVLRY